MALCTAAQIRGYDASVTSSEDALLTSIAAAVSSVFATVCGYPPASAGADPTMEDTTYTVYTDRGAARVLRLDDADLLLPVSPVVSITSIHDDANRDFGAGDLVDSGDYDFDGTTGEVLLRPSRTHGAWTEARAGIKVVAVAGYETVPDDLLHLAIVQSLAWLRGVQRVGLANMNQNGVAVTFSPRTLLPEVVEGLQDYRLHLGGMA